MRRALVIVGLLVATVAAAQVFSGGGGSGVCNIDALTVFFADRFRATTVAGNVPGFECDGLNPACVKFGPGIDTGCGVNASGEVVCGRSGQTTGIWRFWGTGFASLWSGTNLTATANVTAGAAYLFGANAFLQNATSAKPVLVDDSDGFQVKCKATIGTCTSALENSEVPVCGTGGALTKRCVCMGDGTTYAWRNLYNLSAGAGTSTTCPNT